MKNILIAGIGNIFLGDDGFGCEVLRQLLSQQLPPEVTAIDFGIRSYDLTYALLENYDAIVLVDAAPRGGAPGTTYFIEIDPNQIEELEAASHDPHSMNPVRALQVARSLGLVTAKIYLVGCEPQVLDVDDRQIEISESVRRAIPQALELIQDFIGRGLRSELKFKNSEVVA